MKNPLIFVLISTVPAIARLMEPTIDAEPERKGRRLSGTARYLKTSKAKNGSGTSPEDPYNDAAKAVAALQPGDTLYLMGVIKNPSFDDGYEFGGDIDDPHLWHGENTLTLFNVKGTRNDPITIKSYDDSTTVRGDGANIIRVKDCEYVVIDGLHVKGEVNKISLETAKALQFVYRDKGSTKSKYRINSRLRDIEDEEVRDAKIADKDFDPLEDVSRPSYTDTRGIYVSGCYHVTISNCRVHHMPGGGIRVSYTEYADVIGNEVHDTARKSYSGTHALVITYAQDDRDGRRTGNAQYRARVTNNFVHNNYNEIYSWAPGKTKIHTKIDEGKGISLQRNQKWRYGGRILVANNLAAYNGYSGVHSNDGDNIDIFSNTAYLNSVTSAVTYGYERAGSRVGISLGGGDDCRIGNNVVVVDTDARGAPIVVTEDTANVKVHTNIVWGYGSAELKFDDTLGDEGNTIVEDPLLAHPIDQDKKYSTRQNITPIHFAVKDESPAIGAGKPRFSTGKDFHDDLRDQTNPTIGGVERPFHMHLGHLEDLN